MSNALLSDVEARAERRRTRTSAEVWEELAREAWTQGQRARAHGNLAAGRRWLERAHRLAPQDGLVQLSLASLLLEAGDPHAALGLFQAVAERYRLPDALIGLAASALMTGDTDTARRTAEAALRSSVVTPALRSVAEAVTARLELPGWCGLDGDGRFHVGPNPPASILLDRTAIRGAKLPPRWRSARQLTVRDASGPFLGSPLSVQAIVAVEGFAEARAGGVEGWAWHPADPDRDPRISIRGPLGRISFTASEPAEGVAGRPLARPRRFAIPAGEVARLGHPLAVTDPNGRHLLGSPLDPAFEARPDFVPVWADRTGHSPEIGPATAAVEIVIPVYRGKAETLACLRSVLATVPAGTAIRVVEDASPEPDLVQALLELAASGRLRLTRHADNRGFPASANAGLRAAAGRDVVLLNSDTLVPPGWLDRMRRAAYAAPDIGTVTPFSNDATIVSYPDRDGGNVAPDLRATKRLDRLAQRANGGQVVDLPVGVGFCLYIRRDCLDQVGPLREDLFAQGYGEENDFCLRARHLGWRNVAAPDVFVGHVGGRSFGDARAHLIRRNTAILNRLHPGYDALIEAHLAADPLHEARRRMDALRWAAGRSRAGAAVLVTHAGGGGVDQVIRARCEALRRDGLRPIILRPTRTGCRVESPGESFPNLAYALPAELPALAALLRPDLPRHLELHHLLGHKEAVRDLVRLLDLPLETWVHDYALFCPRIALVSRERRYCGEPDLTGCEECIADLGGLLEEDIPVRTLVSRSAADLARSRRVVAPSHDAAQRLRRHFPDVRPEILPWENDAELPDPAPAPPAPAARICVVGAIGLEKGFEVLLGCVRDAARRQLPLEFIVCGYTADDARLLEAGPVSITGEYKEAEAVALIRAQAAHFAFIPSVWPETWCFALSRAWQAGLMAVAFDLGAQAERIRATGRGRLLPLGLSPRAVNDALLSLAPPGSPSQSPPRSGP